MSLTDDAGLVIAFAVVETADTVAAWVGTVDARKLASRLRSLLVLQRACAGDDVLSDARELAARVPVDVQPPLQRALVALQRSGRECSGDLVDWKAHLEEALAELQEFVNLVREAGDDG